MVVLNLRYVFSLGSRLLPKLVSVNTRPEDDRSDDNNRNENDHPHKKNGDDLKDEEDLQN